jgi:plastocyanin
MAWSLICPAWASDEKTLTVIAGPDGVQRIRMVAGSYFFEPNHLIVKVNMKTELTVMKEGGLTPHDIEMASGDAGMEFSESLSSTPKTIVFTPTKTGTFPFFCGKKAPFTKSHRERGMEGIMEVVP